MHPDDIDDIELDLLLEGVYRRWGYDFRDYSRATLRRRIKQHAQHLGLQTPGQLIAPALRDVEAFHALLQTFSVNVTEMFRDPPFYLSLRKNVIPLLRTFPYIKVWHAGCASGEEVMSTAILLHEEGLYDRATIYATDINDTALERAKEGIYPLEVFKNFAANYQAAGGKGSLMDYIHADDTHAIVDRRLTKNVTFALHNLAVDGVFSEMHLVICRNVLIYFNRQLQDRAIGLFHESLVNGGILALGSKETLHFSRLAPQFKALDDKWKIYRKHHGHAH